MAAGMMLFLLAGCGGKLPSGVTSGLGDLGGMKPEEASARLDAAFSETVEQGTLKLTCHGVSAELDGSAFQLRDMTEQLARALDQLSAGDTVTDTVCTVEGDRLRVEKGVSGESVILGGGPEEA